MRSPKMLERLTAARNSSRLMRSLGVITPGGSGRLGKGGNLRYISRFTFDFSVSAHPPKLGPSIVRLQTGINSPETGSENKDPRQAKAADFIRVRGARTHNLRNISVDLPRNRLIVITALPGSGILARLRPLYAKASAASGVALHLREAVPAAHGDARRRMIEGCRRPSRSSRRRPPNPRSTGHRQRDHDYLRCSTRASAIRLAPSRLLLSARAFRNGGPRARLRDTA